VSGEPGSPGSHRAPDAPVAVDKIYMSWSEAWDLHRYVEGYLRERPHLPKEARRALLRIILLYPGDPPFTKANMDYFLDANFGGDPHESPRLRLLRR
jgi:hypothetical protein